MLTDPRAADASSGHLDKPSRSMEAAMSDFAVRIRESVQAARGSSKQPRESPGRWEAGSARPLRQREQPGPGLAAQVWERIRVAAHASDGGLIVARNSGSGTSTFELRWHEGQPARSLTITVGEADGMIQAS
jgi:hypothetical protein